MSRVAVILFNLGGPDRPDAIEPFLFNLFNDPAIIALPWPIRPLLAWLIAKRRASVARAIYAQLGGGSPILALTLKQAAALEARLRGDGLEARAFVSMRYWHPTGNEVAREVAAWNPSRSCISGRSCMTSLGTIPAAVSATCASESADMLS